MNLLQKAVEFTTPSECIVCSREISVLCDECEPKIIVKVPSCYRCNAQNTDGATCKTCKRHTKLAGVSMVSRYDDIAQVLIRRLKYEFDQEAGRRCAQLMAELVVASDFDLVTAAPTTPARRRQRGYDQAELLAREVAKLLVIPYLSTLVRVRPVHQIGVSREQRFKQAVGLFTARSAGRVRNQRVLLVDDVVTTGATLSAAAEALIQAGAKRVWGLAMARD